MNIISWHLNLVRKLLLPSLQRNISNVQKTQELLLHKKMELIPMEKQIVYRTLRYSQDSLIQRWGLWEMPF